MSPARSNGLSHSLLALSAVTMCFVLGTSGDAGADAWTRVYINGSLVPVSFNDGDSFRVHGGDFSGSQCRLGGFNTLESFGPAHQWGSWHPYELYVNAKMATLNGRRGTWHCFSDGSRDGYGRLLMDCPDLAVDQIRRGLAHAYQIDDTPSRPEYLRAQQEAIRERRGMWAHGVPELVMTSVHSFDEDRSRDWHYNRLVSTRDGHSESMQHRETYSECQWVCAPETTADPVVMHGVARQLRGDPQLSPLLGAWSNLELIEFVTRFTRNGALPAYATGDARAPLEARLTADREAGRLGQTHQEPGSCAIYVDFTRRYGQHRASCLAGHGTLPPHVRDVWHGAH